MAITRCPGCSQKVLIEPGITDQAYVCPHCHRHVVLAGGRVPVTSIVGIPTPTAAQETCVEREEGFTIGECLKVLSSLPDRRMVRRFPDGSEDGYGLGIFMQEIAHLPTDGFLYTPNFYCILKRIRMTAGWACLEYGCAFDHLERLIIRDEPHVGTCEAAAQVFLKLRHIESMVEIGADKDAYSTLLVNYWMPVKDFGEFYKSSFPLFSDLVQGAFQNYRTALDLWRQGAGHIPVQFIGGGFGIQGALTGMAISMGLNTLTGVYNQSKSATLQQRLIAEWAIAARKVAIAKRVMAIGSTMPREQQR